MFERYELKWSTLWLAIAWLLVAVVIVLSLVRLGATPPRSHSDKFGHVLAYATLIFWFGQIYARARAKRLIAIGLVLMGIALEIAQEYTGYRTFDYADIAANTIGVFIGWLIGPPRTSNLLVVVERLG